MTTCKICNKPYDTERQFNGHLRWCNVQRIAVRRGKFVATAKPVQIREASMLTINAGAVRLTGCEWDGGFLLINDSRVKFFASLQDAINELKADSEKSHVYVREVTPLETASEYVR